MGGDAGERGGGTVTERAAQTLKGNWMGGSSSRVLFSSLLLPPSTILFDKYFGKERRRTRRERLWKGGEGGKSWVLAKSEMGGDLVGGSTCWCCFQPGSFIPCYTGTRGPHFLLSPIKRYIVSTT